MTLVSPASKCCDYSCAPPRQHQLPCLLFYRRLHKNVSIPNPLSHHLDIHLCLPSMSVLLEDHPGCIAVTGSPINMFSSVTVSFWVPTSIIPPPCKVSSGLSHFRFTVASCCFILQQVFVLQTHIRNLHVAHSVSLHFYTSNYFPHHR